MKKLSLSLALTALLSLAACGGGASMNEVASSTFPYPRLAPSSPPMPQMEERPVADKPMQQIWRPGFWAYNGTTFFWISGHYMMRPDPTAAWSPDRWEQRTFGWAFVPGYWQ